MDPLWIQVKSLMDLLQRHDVSDADCKKSKFLKVNIHILGLFLTLEDGHCIPVLE